MENREEAMRYVEEHGSLLYKYNRPLILEMVINYLEGQKKSTAGFKPERFLAGHKICIGNYPAQRDRGAGAVLLPKLFSDH